MPWQKSFDVEEALTKAMHAFWAHGYEATSMRDLVADMGIGQGSIYATFGDKRHLFLEALRHYDRHHRKDWTDRLATNPSPRAAILAAFAEVTEAALQRDGRIGCLLVNTALELSPHDREVGEIVAHGLEQMETFFADQLVRAQAAGEVGGRLVAGEVAKGLLALLVGLRVFACSRPEPTLLTAVAKQAEALMS